MKIGIFDSGLGGLITLHRAMDVLAPYDFVFLGDTARLPYGDRPQEEILAFTIRALEYLFKQDCKLVLIFCNTVSAESLRKIQQEYLPQHFPDRNVLGIIIPMVESILDVPFTHDRESKGHRIGVLATQSTVDSGTYVKEIHKLMPHAQVFQQAAPKLVPMIESGELNILTYGKIVSSYLEPLLTHNIDTLILGCTHYPIIKSHIQKLLPPQIRLICQNEIISEKLKTYLSRHPEIESTLTKSGSHRFLVTKLTPHFEKEAKAWFGDKIELEEVWY